MLFRRKSHKTEYIKAFLYFVASNVKNIVYAIPTYNICIFILSPNIVSQKKECLMLSAINKINKAIGAVKTPAGRVFRCFSKVLRAKVRASLTVEASLALPVFLSVMLLMSGLFRAMTVYESIDNALCITARKAAAYSVSEDGVKKSDIKKIFYQTAGASSVNSTYVKGGIAGISLKLSESGKDNGIIRIDAGYKIRLPGFMLGKMSIKVKDSVSSRVWTGLKLGSGSLAGDASGSEVGSVIVADNGVVYHTDENCTYLSLSVTGISSSAVSSKRNQYGAKYKPCESCSRAGMNSTVYITKQGNAWHNDKNCSGLKRSTSLSSVEAAEKKGLHKCPRCGKK